MPNFIEVTFTDLKGKTYILSDNRGTGQQLIVTTGTVQYGNYTSGDTVTLKVTDSADSTCFEERQVLIDC